MNILSMKKILREQNTNGGPLFLHCRKHLLHKFDFDAIILLWWRENQQRFVLFKENTRKALTQEGSFGRATLK
jgi:hypothetical protein